MFNSKFNGKDIFDKIKFGYKKVNLNRQEST